MTAERARPLRVAMATARYLPERGGTAIHTREVARGLDAAGVDVTIFTTTLDRSAVGETVEDGLLVVRVRAWPRHRDYYFAPGLERALRRGKFDLLHLQGYHTLFAPIALFAARRLHLPYVVTFHSGGHSSALRNAVRPAQVWLLRRLLRRARALLAVSEFEANLFTRRLGLPRSAVIVIPSGVDLPIGPATEPAEPEPLILSVGRLEQYKGHHRAVEALPLVRSSRPDMRLRVVGSGPYEAALRRLAVDLGVADAVEIAAVDASDRTGLADVLRRAAVVALLSDYESQGLAAHEALALGRPLLVSDQGALAEFGGHPNVRVVGASAPGSDVARAIIELADSVPAPPPPTPTWAECVAEVLKVYEQVGATRLPPS